MTCFWDKFWDGESIRLPFAFTLLCLYHIHTSFCSHARFISMLDVALSLIAFVMDVGLLKFFISLTYPKYMGSLRMVWV